MIKKDNRALGCGDTQGAQQNIHEFNSTQIIVTLKADCFRLVSCLSIEGGSLC
jgi:hypothetical protein